MEMIKVQNPLWLKHGLIDTLNTLSLIERGIYPPKIIGWSVLTCCMRLIRAVFNEPNNIKAAELLRQYYIVADKEMQKLNEMNG